MKVEINVDLIEIENHKSYWLTMYFAKKHADEIQALTDATNILITDLLRGKNDSN